jgi:hypothetical protein
MGDTSGDVSHQAVDREKKDRDAASEQLLSERFLDLFVFLPTGLIVTVAEELPKLAERGRERLGVQVNSARAVGQFAVRAGTSELKKRSEGMKRSGTTASGDRAGTAPATGRTVTAGSSTQTGRGQARLRTIPYPPDRPAPRASVTTSEETASPALPHNADAHIPDVASLAIPGFDTLSASQVVQRLDGLNRTELVATRAYEISTRGRRTILSRVDQLLDQRS